MMLQISLKGLMMPVMMHRRLSHHIPSLLEVLPEELIKIPRSHMIQRGRLVILPRQFMYSDVCLWRCFCPLITSYTPTAMTMFA